uniref:Uncharacterized protein n=1 Tax=Romanomermis culicivorax TaxID=13658 RepID=A0A915KF24_ROMCU
MRYHRWRDSVNPGGGGSSGFFLVNIGRRRITIRRSTLTFSRNFRCRRRQIRRYCFRSQRCVSFFSTFKNLNNRINDQREQ